jgi:hypothetical protein
MTFMFEVGKEYRTQGGKTATVLGRDGDCLVCSDGIHRYDRGTHGLDAGRCTGTAHDYSDERNFTRADRPRLSATQINAELLDALKELVDYDTYETEYDGQMLTMCHQCGWLETGSHDKGCMFEKARAAIARAAAEIGLSMKDESKLQGDKS